MKYQSNTVNQLTAIGQKIEQAGFPTLSFVVLIAGNSLAALSSRFDSPQES